LDGLIQPARLNQFIDKVFFSKQARWKPPNMYRLLSFTDGVEIVSPEPLKAIIRQHACRLVDHHRG
jgi:hypothetical protein